MSHHEPDLVRIEFMTPGLALAQSVLALLNPIFRIGPADVVFQDLHGGQPRNEDRYVKLKFS